jgi:hypothetical protein
MLRLLALAALGMASLVIPVEAQGLRGSRERSHPPRPDRVVPSSPGRRGWEDEIVYVIAVSRFFDGDQANNVMLRRFGKDRSRYDGGFWGGDLEGIIRKLDYVASLGVTALLLYPVMDNDDSPFGKYLATAYRPKDYFRVVKLRLTCP